MGSALAPILCLLFFSHSNKVESGQLASGSRIIPANASLCAAKKDHCWDGYSCFKTGDTCDSGKALNSFLYNYGGCGECGKWAEAKYDLFCFGFDVFVGDPNYPQLPNGTTFSSSAVTFGTSPYRAYMISRYQNDKWNMCGFNQCYLQCSLWRAPSAQVTVNCPTGYYPIVSTVYCRDVNTNHPTTSNMDYNQGTNVNSNNHAECCNYCYSYISEGKYCAMCAKWDNMPSCRAGCVLPTLSDGQVNVISDAGGKINNLYRGFANVSYDCYPGYYLSTLDVAPVSATCIVSENNVASWTTMPTCLKSCPNITTFSNGHVQYITLTNRLTGVYHWNTVATFNCSTGYYLSTLSSMTTTNCTVSGNWTAIPQCLVGCPPITTFVNGQTIPYSPNTLVNSLYTQGTTAMLNCSAGYYLSALTTVGLSTCLVTGKWSFVPNCTVGCPPVLSFPNSNAIIYSPRSTTDNGVYRQNSFVTFSCLNSYYLSTLTLSNSTDCSGNGNWSNIPTCLAACPTLQLASGTISYSPKIPTYISTGYVPQSTLAIFNCSTNFFLNPPNYVYKCTGPNWNLGPSVPVCQSSLTNPIFLSVTKISMTLSCSFLVTAIGIIILVTFFIRDFSIETCSHLNEEFALFFAHLLLLIFRDRVDLTDICPAASAAIQYFFTTASLCMMIEAIHSDAILQNVISFDGVFCSHPRFKNFAIGWFVPIIPTGVTIAMRYDKYPSTFGCYVNLGDQIALYIMAPITLCFCLTIILTEAAAMGDWKPLPLSSKFQRLAAHVNQKAMAPLVFLSFGSWFFGLWASYLNSPYVCSFGSVINMAFGVSIVVFHFFGNPKLNNWLHQKVLKHLCKKQQDP